MENKSEWLANLKAGDLVYIDTGHSKRIVKIDGLRKNFIIVGDSKFRRKDGLRVGNYGYRYTYIEEVDDSKRAIILALNLKHEIYNGSLEDLSLDKLKEIKKIIRSKDE